MPKQDITTVKLQEIPAWAIVLCIEGEVMRLADTNLAIRPYEFGWIVATLCYNTKQSSFALGSRSYYPNNLEGVLEAVQRRFGTTLAKGAPKSLTAALCAQEKVLEIAEGLRSRSIVI